MTPHRTKRGRPTADPKCRVLAVRLAERHVEFLRAVAAAEHVTLSEALRRVLDRLRACHAER